MRIALLVLAVAGCGRIAFDELGEAEPHDINASITSYPGPGLMRLGFQQAEVALRYAVAIETR